MSNPHVLNPDSVILQQLDGHWQKVAAMLLYKLAGRDKVTLTFADMNRFSTDFAPGIPTIFTHGHSNSIDFQIIPQDAARHLAAHDSTMRGTA